MTAVTDEMLIAYVDGELSEADRTLVDSAVAADPALFDKLEQHRRMKARVFGAFAMMMLMTLGYIVVWAWWWLARTRG